MRLHDPHRGQGFEHFRTSYKPHIRPDGQLRRLRQAFNIDVGYQEEFKLLSPWLRRAQQDWAEQIVDQLLHYDGITSAFGDDDRAVLRRLYDQHARLFASGVIDEAYLDSLEDVALFFLYHEVRSVWLAGAYGRLEEGAVDYFFKVAKERRNAPIRRLMRRFSKGMTLELSQIQRVFICYERHLQAIVLGEDAEGVAPNMVGALRDSLSEITSHGSALARRFFAALEERAPELETLSPSTPEQRTEFFVEAVTRAVACLANAAETEPPIRAFGRSLVGAPLKSEHRKTVETALLSTLKQAFGAKWEGDLERAWTALYRKVSLIALDARDEARAEAETGSAAPETTEKEPEPAL